MYKLNIVTLLLMLSVTSCVNKMVEHIDRAPTKYSTINERTPLSFEEKKKRIIKLLEIKEQFLCDLTDSQKEQKLLTAFIRDYESLPRGFSDVGTQLEIDLVNKYIHPDYKNDYYLSNAIIEDHFHAGRPAELLCVKDIGSGKKELDILTYSFKDLAYAHIDSIILKELNSRYFILPYTPPRDLPRDYLDFYFSMELKIIPTALISIRLNKFKQDMRFDPNCIACE